MRLRASELSLLVAGLVVGAVAMWLLRPSEVTEPSAPPIIVAADPEQPERAEQPAPPPPENPGPASATAPLPPVDVSPGPIEEHAGVITGRVRWQDGTACAGLNLAAEFVSPTEWRDSNVDGLTPAGRDAVYRAQIARLTGNNLAAQTSAEGRFEISGVGPGRHRIMSTDRDVWVYAGSDSLRAANAQAGAELELTARRAIYGQFELVLPTGEMLSSGVLWLYLDGNQLLAGDSNWFPGRKYALLPGKRKLKAFDVLNGLWQAEMELDVPPEGLPGPVRVELARLPVLAVRHRAPTPHYAYIQPYIIATDELEHRKHLSPEELGHSFLPSNEGWVWNSANPAIVRGLKPGRYTVFLMLGRVVILGRADVEYSGEYQEIEVEVAELAKQDHIVLRVFGPDDKPLTGVTVQLRADNSGIEAHAAAERGAGEYWIRRIEPRFLTFSAGASTHKDLRIEVSHPLYGQRVLVCPWDTRQELTLKFAGKAKLVVLLDNFPPERGNVEIAAFTKDGFARGAFEQHGRSAIALDRNEFELAAGPVTVIARIKFGVSNSTLTLLNQDLELPPGGREVRLSLPHLYELRVRAGAGIDSKTVSISTDPPRTLSAKAEGDVTVFTHLLAGTYTLRCEAGVMKVEVPAFGDIEFVPLPFNALRVRATEGQVIHRAGFLTGDLVREINGAPVSGGAAATLEAFFRAADGGEARFAIEREGQRLTLTVTKDQWANVERNAWAVRVD